MNPYKSDSGFIVTPLDNLPLSVDREFRWGFIGCGKIANDFALVLNHLEQAEVYAVSARDTDRARAFASRHGAEKFYGSYAELVNDPLVDVVYIATVTEFHADHAKLVLNAGKHLLIEKPIALSVDEVSMIRSLARSKGLFCMEAMWMRFFPAMEYCKNVIKSGELGEVGQVRADLSFDLKRDEGLDSPTWKTGGIFDAGVYPVHQALMICGGKIKDSECSGVIDGYGFGQVGAGLLHARFEETLTAMATWSILYEGAEEMDIYGSKGRIRVHSPAHSPTCVTVIKYGGSRRKPENTVTTHEFPLPPIDGEFNFPSSEGLYYEAAAVQRCIAAGLTECPQVPLDESLQAIELLNSCDRIIKKRAG
ncbi:Gfo/Idh/MocA family oxidoreductase [Microbulbifer sp. OS29]|uniref:Gfo/Idh/MocA family oxidoreductase n=1 Tax=Microbulbifer okhotskensis TaxID=2926617 RepID=A0A9X2ELE3_9GAMM|nr:Gfo/Idh/MocA family oxidoreductase [Microbulbifer okhotskensis]MCO1334402.1 Gfo/Idh/MocA family oxidoreductase [Microbulbifer okhotskensis]